MGEQRPGTKLAEQLMARPEGATMDEIVAATGGPQYNVLRRLEARGYHVRKVKEGRGTRYFADPPASISFEATVTEKGQMTVPKEVREHLRLRAGQKLKFVVEKDGRVAVVPASHSISEFFGMLGKPPRSASLEDMDDAIAEAAVERYRRSR